jgi:hypothetical protein
LLRLAEGINQTGTRLQHQRTDPHDLGLAVVDAPTAAPSVPVGQPHRKPAGGSVGGAAEPGGVDEGFRQLHGVPVRAAPVGGKAFGIPGQDHGGEVGYPDIVQDQKARVIGDERQPRSA